MECYGPHGAGAWENSVDAIVIGPVQNARQAQELSRMVGRHTVMTSSTSRQRNSQIFMPFSGTAGSSESTQLRELDLIQSSELRQLPPEAAIILAAGTAPIHGLQGHLVHACGHDEHGRQGQAGAGARGTSPWQGS